MPPGKLCHPYGLRLHRSLPQRFPPLWFITVPSSSFLVVEKPRTKNLQATTALAFSLGSPAGPRPSTLDPRPSTLDPRPSTLDARRSTLDARRSTLDARPSTLDLRRSIDGTCRPASGAAPLGLFAALTVFRTRSHGLGSPFSPSAFSLQPSAFSLQPSAFSFQLSAFSLQPSAFTLSPLAFLLLFPLSRPSLQSAICYGSLVNLVHLLAKNYRRFRLSPLFRMSTDEVRMSRASQILQLPLATSWARPFGTSKRGLHPVPRSFEASEVEWRMSPARTGS